MGVANKFKHQIRYAWNELNQPQLHKLCLPTFKENNRTEQQKKSSFNQHVQVQNFWEGTDKITILAKD